MKDTLKSEYKKLVTVRSTYFIIAICIILLIIFAFIVNGYQISKADSLDPMRLSGDITGAVSVLSLFASIIGALLITHEYRYNTIMYTLTASNSRSRVLFSKIIVMTGFAVVFMAFFMTLSPLLTILGAHLHHIQLAPQTIYYKDVIWKGLLYGWGYVMAGLLFGFLIRNVIGTIVTLLLFPTAVESLLGELLKHYSVYMPFTALTEVIGTRGDLPYVISAAKGATIFLIYLIVGWLVAWYLFLHRDAN
jgi:ABC-type transport system involved in multi-copper enzyme maturation permease subunit